MTRPGLGASRLALGRLALGRLAPGRLELGRLASNHFTARRLAPLTVLLLGVALLVGGCSSNRGQGRNTGRAAAGTASAAGARATGTRASSGATANRSGTTDTGSRFVDVAGPVGGIAIETSPLGDDAGVLPYMDPVIDPASAPTEGTGGDAAARPEERTDVAQSPGAPGTPPAAAAADADAATDAARTPPGLGAPPTGPLPAPQLPLRGQVPPAPPLPEGT